MQIPLQVKKCAFFIIFTRKVALSVYLSLVQTGSYTVGLSVYCFSLEIGEEAPQKSQ